MTSTASSPKRIEKVSSDNIVISFDLLSNLTYMASLAAAQLPREAILRRAGEQHALKTSVFFEQVHLLARRLGVEYTRALQMVARKAKASNIRSLLLRFSNTIATGESEQTFIREEARIEGNRYSNEYVRSVENLKKWTDAYAAMMVSVTLIVVVSLVSTLLGALDNSFILIVVGAMFMITSGGVYIILRTAPYEQTTYDGETNGPPDRARARFLIRTLGFIGLMLAMVIGLVYGIGPALVCFAIFLFPAGFMARRDDKKVTAIDKEVASFVRSLGTIAGAKGTTLSSALNSLDIAPLESLQPHLLRLRTRLASQLPGRLSWERFKTDTGNELLRRSTDMLVDGVEMGAAPRGGRRDCLLVLRQDRRAQRVAPAHGLQLLLPRPAHAHGYDRTTALRRPDRCHLRRAAQGGRHRDRWRSRQRPGIGGQRPRTGYLSVAGLDAYPGDGYDGYTHADGCQRPRS